MTEIIGDGRWLAHRYDETNDSIQFRLVPREAQRELTFLTDFEIGDAPLAIHPRQDCLAEVRKGDLATPRMIFHSAFCCSTLLARAFDIPGVSFGLKEPQILNDVAGLQMRRADPRQIAAAMDIALLLLARPIDEGEINVIKPSTVVNPLIPLILAMRPELRGVLLHAPLETFLGSVARKEVEGRAWVRELMWKFILSSQADRFGLSDEDLYRQTDLQVAALGWLTQHALFGDAAAKNANLRALDSETLMKRPAQSLYALGKLFDLKFDADLIANGRAFKTHSKDRTDYSADRRQEERDRGLELHAREIGMVMKWAEKLAQHAGIATSLPPILGN